MHTITLKTDDNFFDMLNDMVKKFNTTRSSLIRTAVIPTLSNDEMKQVDKQVKIVLAIG